MIKLELSVEEINLILASLAKMPLEQSFTVFVKIKKESESQLNTTQAVSE